MATRSHVRSRRAAAVAVRPAIRSPGAVPLPTQRRGPGRCLRRPAATAASTRVARDTRTRGPGPGLVRIPETADAAIAAIPADRVRDVADT